MSRSLGDVLLSNLLENRITSNQLDTKLAIIGYLSGFKYLVNNEKQSTMLVNDSTAFGLIANSTTAVTAMASSPVFVEELVKNSNALYTLVTTANLFNAFKNNAQNWSLLNSFVNQWFSKLKKQTFLTDDTFYASQLNLKAMSIVAVGMGGEGNVSGGSGAEAGVKIITSNLPTDDLTISVGNARLTNNPGVGTIAEGSSITSSVSGTILSVAGGRELLASQALGGGSNTGGNFSNGDITNSPWQFENTTKKGADAGFGNGVAGTAGIFGNGGSAETATEFARPGTGVGSSGGGTFASLTPAINNAGSLATGYGCGSGASSAVKLGGPGIVIAHYILK